VRGVIKAGASGFDVTGRKVASIITKTVALFAAVPNMSGPLKVKLACQFAEKN
jgi:hypothetical protein